MERHKALISQIVRFLRDSDHGAMVLPDLSGHTHQPVPARGEPWKGPRAGGSDEEGRRMGRRTREAARGRAAMSPDSMRTEVRAGETLDVVLPLGGARTLVRVPHRTRQRRK